MDPRAFANPEPDADPGTIFDGDGHIERDLHADKHSDGNADPHADGQRHGDEHAVRHGHCLSHRYGLTYAHTDLADRHTNTGRRLRS
jgi:hypothetical protein